MKEKSDKTNIDITGLDKAEILIKLYNNAKPLTFWFSIKKSNELIKVKAQILIDELAHQKASLYFNFINGRAIKIDLTGNIIDTSLYDLYNGRNKGFEVINNIKNTTSITLAEIKSRTKWEEVVLDYKNGKYGTPTLDEVLDQKGFGLKLIGLNSSDDSSPEEDFSL